MIRKSISKSGKSNRSKKIAKLDEIFSIFIRRRDCTPNGRCISCGKIITFETSDCGHYVNRKHMATRYDEQNCNAQCRACNRFDEGNIMGYRRGLVEKIGIKAVEMLEIKRFNTCPMKEVDLDILIAYYKQKLSKTE